MNGVKITFWFVSIIAIVLTTVYVLNTHIYIEKQEGSSVLEDGEYFGFIRALTDNNTAMDFDDATWLTGKEGENAAIRAGFCTEGTRSECLPNDFFIENTENKSIRIVIDPAVMIFMQTWMMEETGEIASREIDMRDFADLINDLALHWHNLPYRITVTGNGVTRIEEIYVP